MINAAGFVTITGSFIENGIVIWIKIKREDQQNSLTHMRRKSPTIRQSKTSLQIFAPVIILLGMILRFRGIVVT